MTGRPQFGQILSVASSVTSDLLIVRVFSFTSRSKGV